MQNLACKHEHPFVKGRGFCQKSRGPVTGWGLGHWGLINTRASPLMCFGAKTLPQCMCTLVKHTALQAHAHPPTPGWDRIQGPGP